MFPHAPLWAQAPGVGLLLDISPQFPSPNQSVTASIRSSSMALDRSRVQWKINGVVVAEGIGIKNTTFTTGAGGSVTQIEVAAQTPEGIAFTAKRSISPAKVSIIWEADTYVPPFFAGKPLVTPAAQLRLVAVPEFTDSSGRLIPPENLIYSWRRNGREVEDKSGYGAYTVELSNDTFIRPIQYEVEVTSLDEKLTARSEVRIPIAKPLAVLYEEHPLLGVRYQRPIISPYRFLSGESLVVAEPYYYSVHSRTDPMLDYRWTISGARPEARDILILRRGGEKGGKSNIELALRHLGIPLQSNRLPIRVEFPGAADVPSAPTASAVPQF